MTIRIVLGSVLTVAALVVAGRRVWWLSRLIRSGQPANRRLDDLPSVLRIQLVEVIGQRRLLKWTVPGVAHAFTFWGFIVLGLTIIEAWGALFDADFAIPIIGPLGGRRLHRGLLRRRRPVRDQPRSPSSASSRRPPASSAVAASTDRTPARPKSSS